MHNQKITNIVVGITMASFLYFSIPIQNHKAKAANKKLQTRNAYALLMPLVELYTESGEISGGISDDAKKIHLSVYDKYTENINHHKLSWPLRMFAWKTEDIDITKLKKIITELKKASNQIDNETDKQAYKVAIENFFADLKQFFGNENLLPRITGPDKKCQEEVIATLNESHSKTMAYISSVDTLDDSKTEENINKAKATCLANREAVARAFLYSYTYEEPLTGTDQDDKELLIGFRENIDRTIHFNRVLRDSLPADDKRHGFLDKYSHSELRRRSIVQTLIDDDMQKAQELLLAAMESAIAEENAIADSKAKPSVALSKNGVCIVAIAN